jgi:hypothetical protein
MSKFTLKNGGTVEFLRREGRFVAVINGQEEIGPKMLLFHLVNECAEAGYSVPEFLHQLGIEDDGTCAFCNQVRPRVTCPSCGCVARCAACGPNHDDSRLCRQTLELATLHRRMRGGDTLDAEDRYYAIKSLALAYERRMVQ